jgi:dTDP-glucose pyrophosphorylase/CBS domain-containing protein
MTTELKHLFVFLDSAIRQAITCIDRDPLRGIALVVDGEQRLLGTITDGDVRRAMLTGLNLEAPVSALLACKANSPYHQPVTAPVGTPPDVLLQLMQDRGIRQIPLLDESGRVARLVTLGELVSKSDLPLHAVVMAGGLGTRLRPLTEDLPKPMLPVGGRPLLEHIIKQLQQAGIRRINVTTYYKPEKIIEYFGDGRSFGVELSYVNEDRPLGTGGGLGLIPVPQEPQLVINGDILTQINFRAMLTYHQEHRSDMTVAVRRYDLQVPYGVIECDGSKVYGLREKPHLAFFVNAGIYLLEPSVYRFIPNGQHFNMTDLIQWLLNAGQQVTSFPIREYWLDIGQYADYEQAQVDVQSRRLEE